MTKASGFLADLGELSTQLSANEAFTNEVDRAADRITEALLSGHTLYVAGNGGSAAEAQHFAAEIVGRYKRERHGYPAVALTVDTSILTAIGNDYGYEAVFARQLEALGTPGDVFVALSTSGNSENLIRALDVARAQKMYTISLSGKGGGRMRGMVDIECIVPSQETPRIQEIHLLLIHAMCEYIDANLT